MAQYRFRTRYELAHPQDQCMNLPMKILVAALVITLSLHSYLNAPKKLLQVENQYYLLATTVYPSTQEENISLYIPSESFYHNDSAYDQLYWNQELPESWRYNLVNKGKMIEELESWGKVNFKQGYYLCFWADQIGLTIVLLAQKLKHLGKGFIKILIPLHHPKQSITAFKQTISKYQLEQYVKFFQNYPAQLEDQKNVSWIIAPGRVLHKEVLQKYYEQQDPFNSTVQKRIADKFHIQYGHCKWLLYYQHTIKQEQMNELLHLNNEIRAITKSLDGNYQQSSLEDYKNDASVRKFNLLFISNQTVKQNSAKNTKQVLKQHNQTKIELKPINKVIHHPTKTIRRITPKQVTSKLKCAPLMKPQNVQIGNRFQSRFQGISIIKQTDTNLQQVADISHFAKFLMSYFSEEQLSIFYAMSQQQAANIIALINSGNFLLPIQQFKEGVLIAQSLELNGLSKHLIKLGSEWVGQFLLSKVLETNEVKISFVSFQFLAQWSKYIQEEIEQGMDLVMTMKGNLNQKQIIESFRQKGLRTYIIHRRQQKDYDLGCIGDYQFELFQKDKTYPPFSFYFVSMYDITIDPVDPLNFQSSSIPRNMKILPYKCAQPPYQVSHDWNQIKGYILAYDKYGHKLWVPEYKSSVYQLNGIDEEPMVEFINSCLVQTDIILVHSQAIQSQQILVSLIMKVKRTGHLIISHMADQQEKVVDANSELNDLSSAYEVIDLYSESINSVREYYFVRQPSVILTTPSILEALLEKPIQLNKKALIIFKYEEQSAFQNTLNNLMNTYTLYEIRFNSDLKAPSGQCLDYEVRVIHKQNFKDHGLGWFIVVI